MQPQFADQIRNFVITTFLLGERDRLQDDDSFLDQGIIDSTGVLEMISWIEETYGIEVTDGELVPDNFDSVNRVSAYLAKKLNGRASSFLPPDTVAADQ